MKKYLSTTFRLWKLLRDFHKHFYLQLFSTIIQQALNVSIIALTAGILNNIIISNFIRSYELLIIGFILSIINIIIGYFGEAHSQKYLDFEIQQYLEEYSFKKIFKLNASQYIEDHSAIKLQVVNRGESAIEQIVTMLVLNLLPTATLTIFSIFAIAYYSLSIAACVTITLIIATLWSSKFANYHRPFVKKDMDNWDEQRKIRAETFQHLSLIKTLGVEDTFLHKYLKNRLSFISYKIVTYKKSMKHGYKRWGFFRISRTINTIIIIYLAQVSAITVGTIYAIWRWADDAYSQIGTVIQAIRQLPLRFVELDKYLDIIDKEPSFKEEGPEKFKSGDIVFDNVSFQYPQGDSPVLQNMSITIPAGKKVAFVGHSGSGKSTIIKLLLRMYDWNTGDIKIGGVSLKDMSAKSLREHIGYVEQHVDLFDASIKDNILLGVKKETGISASDLESVAHKSRIDQFYHRLGADKFDTQIGERGVKLSGGERQRVGIARALIKNPEVLIFDEATSALDTENEKYIKEAIDEASIGRTSIVVAHRLSTIQDADIIFVMDKGHIVGFGTHESLQETCKEYQALIAAQG